MKYDDASWHYGGEFPPDSPQEYGGTHIALFIKWCFRKGWAGEIHLEKEVREDIEGVIKGTLSATKFFFMYCDGKFTDEDLNEEGNAFAQRYYGKNGRYLSDYAEHFGDKMYVSPESDHDYDKYEAMIESRYQSGDLSESEE